MYVYVDGHHKLIRWRLVTHGGIDGYSRMIVYLKCSNNNSGSTVLENFQKAVHHFGLPSRVRCDQGTENHEVALHMLRYRGLNRNSIITGSSTHNQRIERLWRDMHRSVTTLYYSLFYFLEIQSLLDPLNEVHLFALSYIYLPRVNRALNVFTEGWNHHGIRTAHNHSPYQLFVSGMLQLHSSGNTALDFFSTVDNNYGIDLSDGLSLSEENSVIVPQSQLIIPDTILQNLKDQIDPLAYSDNYGIELYEQTITFIEQALHLND